MILSVRLHVFIVGDSLCRVRYIIVYVLIFLCWIKLDSKLQHAVEFFLTLRNHLGLHFVPLLPRCHLNHIHDLHNDHDDQTIGTRGENSTTTTTSTSRDSRRGIKTDKDKDESFVHFIFLVTNKVSIDDGYNG